MPVAPTTQTTVVPNSTSSHDTDHANFINPIINKIYLANIGTTRTAAFTITQAMSGEVIPVNPPSTTFAITVPSLAVGTTVELVAISATYSFTLAASGVTFLPVAGTPRTQGSSVSLLWLTTTSVLVSGDLT